MISEPLRRPTGRRFHSQVEVPAARSGDAFQIDVCHVLKLGPCSTAVNNGQLSPLSFVPCRCRLSTRPPVVACFIGFQSGDAGHGKDLITSPWRLDSLHPARATKGRIRSPYVSSACFSVFSGSSSRRLLHALRACLRANALGPRLLGFINLHYAIQIHLFQPNSFHGESVTSADISRPVSIREHAVMEAASYRGLARQMHAFQDGNSFANRNKSIIRILKFAANFTNDVVIALQLSSCLQSGSSFFPAVPLLHKKNEGRGIFRGSGAAL